VRVLAVHAHDQPLQRLRPALNTRETQQANDDRSDRLPDHSVVVPESKEGGFLDVLEDGRGASGECSDVVLEDESGDGSEALVFVGDAGKDVDEVPGVVGDRFERFETLQITTRPKEGETGRVGKGKGRKEEQDEKSKTSRQVGREGGAHLGDLGLNGGIGRSRVAENGNELLDSFGAGDPTHRWRGRAGTEGGRCEGRRKTFEGTGYSIDGGKSISEYPERWIPKELAHKKCRARERRCELDLNEGRSRRGKGKGEEGRREGKV
jgi:hypothetical protein